ncbi:biotin--[acetyl-CoA-carboxylase] ligase [Halomonas halodenitrificans]|uniref:biotin--[acetyl-CoA-carboxylase] ligase n=1 Tax=Halomonas halodenitrificans TaxID=28252 RepID=UPI000483FC33|nr:biotin--[acetyl-CoA-carboxylase] ligase [Halomonas halodenitrificans]
MTIGDLIRLLDDGEFHSGEQLGEKLGVSRAAVWKQLRKLESLGITMEAVKGQGYRLAEPLELLDGQRIIAGLSRQARGYLTRLFVEETLPSSNAFLRERFSQGAGHGEVCLVEQQSAGRGRRGRAWNTPWGKSLMLSLGWRVESGIGALEGLSLAVGVVLARVLESHGVSPYLKWPNDVLLEVPNGDYGKLAGILVEVSGDASGPCEVVVGMGLNVFLPESFRSTLGQSAAAVEDQATGVSRNALASDLLEALLPLVADFERDGFAPWCDAWNARHAFAGREVDVLSGNTREVARVEEADASGSLVVSQGGRRRHLAGGEISLRVRS